MVVSKNLAKAFSFIKNPYLLCKNPYFTNKNRYKTSYWYKRIERQECSKNRFNVVYVYKTKKAALIKKAA